jgi:hypothetical protein
MVKVEFQMNDGSPVRAVKVANPTTTITLYIDNYEEKAYKSIDGIANAMVDNDDIDSYEQWLCQNYTASAIVEMVEEYGCEEAMASLKNDYEDYKIGAAFDLLESKNRSQYFTVEVEI